MKRKRNTSALCVGEIFSKSNRLRKQVRDKGETYKVALEALLAYLIYYLLMEDHQEEIRRTENLLDILGREIKAVWPK